MPALFVALALAVQSTAAPSPVDFSNTPVTPGRWSYSAVAGGSAATFTDSSGAARLAIRCAPALRRVSISRAGAAPATSMSVWASAAMRNVAARFDPASGRVTAELSAYDPLLDAIAFSRGRFAVLMPGFAPLVVPAWPEPARAVEDCRS